LADFPKKGTNDYISWLVTPPTGTVWLQSARREWLKLSSIFLLIKKMYDVQADDQTKKK